MKELKRTGMGVKHFSYQNLLGDLDNFSGEVTKSCPKGDKDIEFSID